jgi:MinD-like ATPase involved in chromosome partitioning or flagellar assembly
MGPEQAVADEYDVLFIDDVCSFLTPRLVRSLRGLGREIVGVYNPADAPDAKRHLLDCGIADVIESEASADEFLSIAEGTLVVRRPARLTVVPRSGPFRVGVFGPLGGVGVTEVAIALAFCLNGARPTALLDLDQANPSVAQRLDLPLHPNLMTAVDSAHHSGRIGEALIDCQGLAIVGGLATQGSHELSPVEIDGVMAEVGGVGFDVLVADLGASRADRLGSLLFDALIAVGLASPIGMARLVRTIQAVLASAGGSDLVAAVNRAGRGGRRRLEVRAEMVRLIPQIPVVLFPEDRSLERAAWDGKHLDRGPFLRSVSRVAELIGETSK